MLNAIHSEDVTAADPAAAGYSAPGRPDKTDATAALADPLPERHGYQVSSGSRIFGGFFTASIVPIVLVIALVTLRQTNLHKAVSRPLVVSLVHAADLPKTEPKTVSPPRPAEKQVETVEPRQVPHVQPPALTMPSVQAPPIVASRTPVESKPAEVTPPAAPQHTVAPSVPSRVSHHGPDRWEGRVLARLEHFRHYPPDAQRQHIQGTVVIRFRLNRDGRVLSASLERSSGSAVLDQAAMETLRNADPLPKIPADRPDQVELVVPVEFTISR
jgi:protein TonB